MKRAIMLEQSDIKKLIAEKYQVSEKNVIKNQFSYTVILDPDEENEKNSD